MFSFFRLTLCSSLLATVVHAETTFRSGPGRVTLVELYTSEGCSSCPPAEKWLGERRNDPGLWRDFVPVALHVNYWDHLGWRDALAAKAFTDREYAYAAAWGSGSVYTPCFVRDGAEWQPKDSALSPERSGGDSGTLQVVWQPEGRTCRIDYTAAANAKPAKSPRAAVLDYDVYVALLGSGIVNQVRKGENAGRELRHEFVALRLESASMKRAENEVWSATVALPPRPDITSARMAIAAWVVKRGSLIPLQATGGWIE